MTRTIRTLTLGLSLCAASAAAQPVLHDTLAAQTTGQTQTGGQPTLPLSIDLLPYGTVTLADGAYLIPNYQNTGISLYVQSPRPLRVATLDEMVRYQAEWLRTAQGLPPASPAPAAPVARPGAPALQPAWPSTQALTPARVPVGVQTAPVARPAPAPVTPPAALPNPSAQRTQPLAAPVVSAQARLPQGASTLQPRGPVPAVPATPAQGARTASATALPDHLRLTFRGHSGTGVYIITYSIMNTSKTASVLLDPGTLRLTQGGQPVPAQFAVRNSSGDDTGMLMPRSAMIGTITVRARSQEPILLDWAARDAQGRDFPIAFTWQP